MISIPASRNALATTFAPRAWTSTPTLSIMTRMVPIAAFPRSSRRTPAEDMDHARDIVRAVPSPCVLGQREPGIGHLPVTCGAAQLRDRLDDLGQAGGADGMPAGQQAAAGVDREPAAQIRVTAADQRRACSPLGADGQPLEDSTRPPSPAVGL